MKHKDVRKLMKKNEFEEILLNAKEYFEKNQENIIIVAVIVLIIIIAVPLYINHKANLELKAMAALGNADYYMNRPVINMEEAGMYGVFKTKETSLAFFCIVNSDKSTFLANSFKVISILVLRIQ